MDEATPVPTEPLKKRVGRRPRTPMATKNASTSSKADATDKSKDEPIDKNDESEKAENDEATEKSDDLDKSDKGDKSAKSGKAEKAEKLEKPTLTERKQAKKEQIEAIIASGGRGKRTPKPNPKYMDEPVASGRKQRSDAENAEAEDGDDEMNHSSDEPRHEGPLKKRMLQKAGIKPMPNRKYGLANKLTPIARRSGVGAPKRKLLEVDINIDDEHGKQLFLDAKRRLTQSPLNSDEDQIKKSKVSVTDALAAQLRSKYPGELPIKRNLLVDRKSIVNRAKIFDSNKIVQQKIEADHERKRKRNEETETSEDDLAMSKSANDPEAISPKNINRRKTQHTKILSDDKIIRTASTSAVQATLRRIASGTVVNKLNNKSPLVQTQLGQKFQNVSAPTKTYSISPQSRTIGGNKPAILRPPPRILNSSLCKPTNKPTVPSLVTKLVTKDDYENDTNKVRNSNIIQSRSKENNVTSYTYTEKDGKMIPKKVASHVAQIPQHKIIQQRKSILPVVRTQPRQQKIISEPVNMSRLVRKITCFETWYVIKSPDLQPKPEKSILSLSLMQIGNEIKKITLPSSDWTYKILLQPLSKQLLAARQSIVSQNESKVASVADEKKELKLNEVKNEKNDKATVDNVGDKSDTKMEADEKLKAEDPKDEQKNDDDKADIKTDSSESDKGNSSQKKSDEKNETQSKSADTSSDKIKASENSEESGKSVKNEKKDNKKVRKATRFTRSQKAESDVPEEEENGKSEESKDVEHTKPEELSSDEKNKDASDKDSASETKEPENKKETAESNGKEEDAKQLTDTDEEGKKETSDADVKKEETNVEQSETKEVASNVHDIYSGEVQDPNIKPEERHNYRPINIMFRRKCQNPNIRIQFDRTVILKNQAYYLNVDGKNVRLIASPQAIETYNDLKVLLQIVHDASLKNCFVESTTAIASSS